MPSSTKNFFNSSFGKENPLKFSKMVDRLSESNESLERSNSETSFSKKRRNVTIQQSLNYKKLSVNKDLAQSSFSKDLSSS